MLTRNEMSLQSFCEQEGTDNLERYDFIGRDGRTHHYFALGNTRVIWASDRAQAKLTEGMRALQNGNTIRARYCFNSIKYVECIQEGLPDFNNQGRSNWVPSLMVCNRMEIGTLYAHKIYKLHYHSFADIRSISIWFLGDYSDEEKEELKKEINRGVDVLTTYEQLHAYMFCFGQMHEAKLRRAFGEIPLTLLRSEIEVLDYACGQGIATVCFADYVKNANKATVIKKITLIEPSNIALSRAALLCHKVIPNALIETVASGFDKLRSEQITNSNVPKIHLLSNILDMTCYDLSHLAKVINRVKNKGDLFICVDPWYHDVSRDGRQRVFMRLLHGEEIYHEAFNAYELQEDKSWTAYITIFKV